MTTWTCSSRSIPGCRPRSMTTTASSRPISGCPRRTGRNPNRRMSSPLDGYTVIDLSSGIAGAYATKILADGGAAVIKVESPEGDPLRRWSASGADIGPDRDGALFAFLAGGKRSVVVDHEA